MDLILNQRAKTELLRVAGATTALNLAIFIAVTSLPAFQRAHHHWIFPILAGLLAAQWILALALPTDGFLNRRAARAAILGGLSFLLVMGIVRHATILACFDRCVFKLGGAAAIAAPVFFAHRWLGDSGFWSPERSTLAGLGALSWAVYLVLRGLQIAPWMINIVFTILALSLWLGRNSAPFLIASLGILSALAIRAVANEHIVVGLGVVWGVGAPLAAVPAVSAWLKRRTQRRAEFEAQSARRPQALGMRIFLSALRVAAAVSVLAGLGAYVAGPISLVTDPAKRQALLRAMASPLPASEPRQLSPLAARLRGHVFFLARTIGERGAGEPKRHQGARDYIVAQLRAAGLPPKLLPFRSQWLASVPDGTEFFNIEAALGHAPVGASAPWIIGAHYDTVATPGADDNASGVAVLIETARLLKERRPGREIRFVAFDLEEPPAFGTRNMGSFRYARMLKENNVPLHGMISLEMLGYFNPRRGSQLYPPFMHLFYPDNGEFAGAVGNLRSFGLVRDFSAAWRRCSSFPLAMTVLPGPASELALSDQINFWDEGFPALMLSDTAFYRNPNYHEASDKPETLDYEKMAQVTRALVGTILLESAPATRAGRQ